MCVRCGALKYVYGSSMHPYQESMYVAVIIGVDAVVYAMCKFARRFNPSPIHIKGVGFTKVLGVFCENVHGVQINFAKS